MDNSTNHAPVTRFAYLDSTTILPKGLASEGIYPRIDLRFKPQFANLVFFFPTNIMKLHNKLNKLYSVTKKFRTLSQFLGLMDHQISTV